MSMARRVAGATVFLDGIDEVAHQPSTSVRKTVAIPSYYRLMLSQTQELVGRVQGSLPEPWNKKIGRPKSFGLYHAVELACMPVCTFVRTDRRNFWAI